MGVKVDVRGLQELEKQLMQAVGKQFPREFEQMVIQVAYELQGRVKERTPHLTGRLQDSWTVGNVVKRDSEYYIEVFTNVEYAEHVEHGYRTRGGKRRVPGVKMMEVSVAELETRLPDFLRDWLSRFLENHTIL